MLITILVGWGIAGIFTAAGILTDDKTQPGYGARTDARSHVIHTTPWFYVPYPGKATFKMFEHPLTGHWQ